MSGPLVRRILRAFVLASCALVALACEDATRAARQAAAEKVGDIAAGRMAEMSGSHARAADFINIPIEVRKLGDFVYQARGVANTQLIHTSEGNVVFDTGVAIQSAKQKRVLEEAVPEAPLTHVILSHSHADHSGGTRFWATDETEIVAHAEFPEEQRYLKELEPYLWNRNRTVMSFMPEEPPTIGFLQYGGIEPTILVDDGDVYRFEQGGVKFEVLPTPGAEGADNLCLWLPDQKILFSGDTFGPFFPQFPNVFTMRGEKVRKPIEYIATLDRIIAFGPEMIVPSHDEPVVGAEQIRADLVKMRDAVQYVHDAVIAGMNAGKNVHELMAEIALPPQLELSQVHGRVSWAVRSIWEYYTTWFHFDSTTELYHVPRSSVNAEVAELAGVAELVELARSHVAAARPLEALHVSDIALGPDPNHAPALAVRIDALQQLLEAAEQGAGNSYEMDWLKTRILDAEARISDGLTG